MSKVRQITMSDEAWDYLKELGEELKYTDPRGPRSQLVREMLSAAITKWREAPYVCRSARHTVLVTGSGDVFYRAIQILKLNSYRERLPCVIEMKPEKRRDFLLNRDPAVEEADWFRSRWLLNRFTVWHGETMDGPPLSFSTDRDGTDAKLADLTTEINAGRLLTREVLVGMRDHVQWLAEGRPGSRAATAKPGGDDRIDIAIDIPTRDLKVVVAVDTSLYKHNSASEKELADLGFEFRNREGARFRGREPGRDPANPMERHYGRKLTGAADAKAAQVLAEVSALQARILGLCDELGEDCLCRTDEERAVIKSSLTIPEHFLYCTASWPSPYFGIEVCVSWEKPLMPEDRKKPGRRSGPA
jgi:hypothetical protein